METDVRRSLFRESLDGTDIKLGMDRHFRKRKLCSCASLGLICMVTIVSLLNRNNCPNYAKESNNNNEISVNGLTHEQNTCGEEVRHVAFVKVHKAGSTSVMNVLERFAFNRKLLLALPKQANILKSDFSNLIPAPNNSTFDMLINHVDHYDRKLFASVLPTDTRYIGIIREPLDLSISAFEFYSRLHGLYQNVPGTDKLGIYLSNREMYEPVNAKFSYTNNRMSYDFGLPQEYFHNTEEIKKFLVNLDYEMDLVLVVEKFSESIVLLKRLMCWQLSDVLYITRNTNDQKSAVAFTEAEIEYHRNFSMADNMLYDYFSERLDKMMRIQSGDFREEVVLFESFLRKVKEFCHQEETQSFTQGKDNKLYFERTRFNKEFVVELNDCKLMLLRELSFVEMSRKAQADYMKQ